MPSPACSVVLKIIIFPIVSPTPALYLSPFFTVWFQTFRRKITWKIFPIHLFKYIRIIIEFWDFLKAYVQTIRKQNEVLSHNKLKPFNHSTHSDQSTLSHHSHIAPQHRVIVTYTTHDTYSHIYTWHTFIYCRVHTQWAIVIMIYPHTFIHRSASTSPACRTYDDTYSHTYIHEQYSLPHHAYHLHTSYPHTTCIPLWSTTLIDTYSHTPTCEHASLWLAKHQVSEATVHILVRCSRCIRRSAVT